MHNWTGPESAVCVSLSGTIIEQLGWIILGPFIWNGYYNIYIDYPYFCSWFFFFKYKWFDFFLFNSLKDIVKNKLFTETAM